MSEFTDGTMTGNTLSMVEMEKRLEALETKLANVGTVYQKTGTLTGIGNIDNKRLDTLSVPAGTYIVTGTVQWNGNGTRHYLTIRDTVENVAQSATDTYGYHGTTVTTTATVTGATDFELVFYQNNAGATAELTYKFTAIRIK